MLDFEKNVLQKALDTRFDGNKNKFHTWLIAQFDENGRKKESDKSHANFEAIIKLAGQFAEKNAEALNDYRNMTFHDDIPIGVNGSFSWFTRKGQPVRDLLQMKEDLHAKKDRSAYMPGGERFEAQNLNSKT